MNWDDLKVFLAVARSESLSLAGKTLHMDPATVGRRISRLESALKGRLFNKSPQGYHLTELGQDLVRHAADAESAAIAARDIIEDSSDSLTGTIRIGAPDGAANFLLPQILIELCDENPGLDIQLVALPRVFNLSKREADMAITVSPPAAGRLTVQKLTDYKLHLAASHAYLDTHDPIASLEDLKGHRLVGYIPDMIFDKELDYIGEISATASATLASNSFSVQINWVLQGAGLGIVHDFAIPAFAGIKKILTKDISLTRSFYLIRHADDRRVERLNRFSRALSEKLRQEVARLEAIA